LVYCVLDKSLELSQRQQLSIMQRYEASAFYTVVRWHKLCEVDNECTLHISIVLAICRPNIIKFGADLTKFWQKQVGSFFGTPCIHIRFTSQFWSDYDSRNIQLPPANVSQFKHCTHPRFDLVPRGLLQGNLRWGAEDYNNQAECWTRPHVLSATHVNSTTVWLISCTTSFIGLTSQLMYRCQHDQTPRYLMDHCLPVSDVVFRQRLRSASGHQLSVPRHRLSTFGRRAFSAVGSTVWNSHLVLAVAVSSEH